MKKQFLLSIINSANIVNINITSSRRNTNKNNVGKGRNNNWANWKGNSIEFCTDLLNENVYINSLDILYSSGRRNNITISE
ncbi:hypothetical protein [Paenisporosarcina indica]|uniref:hypothetical protein n=1 Tax=Paenisporosarcina indica TaxID=650093 RepID=UPI00094F930B|nr:hypothetical protein [Paenisporosarcina indica]